jgi:hypothetical protein
MLLTAGFLIEGSPVGLIVESTLYLFAILALLGLWLFYQVQVRSGRIQAVDLFDRSVVRLYVYVLPDDRPSCDVCAQAQGRVFLPSAVGKIGFSPVDGSCPGAVTCQGMLVGLYGGWVEARQLVGRLQEPSKKHPLRLSPEELHLVVKGAWSKSISADTDRISMHFLEGWCLGQTDRKAALEGLRYVVERAKEPRHLPYVVPAWLRLMELLLKDGREDEARLCIEQFERRFPPERHEIDGPSFAQRKMLQEMKSLLWATRSLKVSV